MIPFGLAKVEAALSNKGRAGDAFLRLGRKYIVNIRRVFHVNAVKQVAVLADDHGTIYTLRLPKPVLRMLMEDISGKPQITTPQRWNCFGRVDYGWKATFRCKAPGQ